MSIDVNYLIEIVEKASFLSERLSGLFVPRTTTDESVMLAIEAKLQRWCQTAAQGDWKTFEKRLCWDDLDIDVVRSFLGPVSLSNHHQLPEWASILGEVLDSAASFLPYLPNEAPYFKQAQPIPFEELWQPFVHFARQSVLKRIGSNCNLLSDEAFTELERDLLQMLSGIGAQAAQLEFVVFQATRNPARLFEFTQQGISLQTNESTPSRQFYAEYIEYMLGGGLSIFFNDYCVVARLVATVTQHWIDATTELISRLAQDLPEIQRLFETCAGKVIKAQGSLSDSHRGGRSVIALEFSSGLKLIYKPRNIDLEVAFNRLLGWINEQGLTPSFKTLKLLNFSSYGWVEFVEHLPCQSEDEAKLYYYRAGMLICILYVLHGADLHRENLIACGQHPVLIDLEMLLYPPLIDEFEDEDSDSVQVLAMEQFKNSVLGSGMLPCWRRGPDGKGFDTSALGGRAGGRTFERPEWSNINTDQMAIIHNFCAISDTSAVPRLFDTALVPNDYLEEIITGFQQMYHFFMERCSLLLVKAGPIEQFKHLRSRFLFRNTSLYAHIRSLGCKPDFMQDGVERSIHLEMLYSAMLSTNMKSRFWPMLREELRALAQMDIPLFSMYTDGVAMFSDTDQVVIPNAFVDTGYNTMIKTLEALNEADMELQSGFIREAFYTKVIGNENYHQTVDSSISLAEIVPFTASQFVEEARAIADKLASRAIRSGKGMTWLTLEFNQELERHELKPLGYGLYSGLAGIALFLGALAKVTGETRYRDMALSVLHPLRVELTKTDRSQLTQLGKRLGLGGGAGIGAIVYVLTRLSQFLDNEALLFEAKKTVDLLTPQLIEKDNRFDVIFGAAGAILGLLTLYDASSDPFILECADGIGRHLLKGRVADASGYRVWFTQNNTPLTGFSHGAAGIGYTLHRLYEKVADSLFLEAAREAYTYEQSQFSPHEKNWPDLRYPPSDGPRFSASWCHGAPGIVLARLGSQKLLDTDDVRQAVELGLETTRQVARENHGIDHLCCGTLGRVETLFVAGQTLASPALTEEALKLSTRLVLMARNRGSYLLFGSHLPMAYSPGFFQGEAGIGYELLRLGVPEQLPSVLLWQ